MTRYVCCSLGLLLLIAGTEALAEPDPEGPPPAAPTPATSPAAPATAAPAAALPEAPSSSALLEGRKRQGPFLASEGSAAFVTHHTLLGLAGGLLIPAFMAGGDLGRAKEAMMISALVASGVGFGVSSWWQFHHWLAVPDVELALAASLFGGMLSAGLVDTIVSNGTALSWAGFLGGELAGWTTVVLGRGTTQRRVYALASAGVWSVITTGLVWGVLSTVGAPPASYKPVVDSLLIAPGVGTLAMAALLTQVNPSAAQVLRADAFGAGVGAAVLLISGLTLGFTSPLPYVLTGLSAAAAITAVSLLWAEAAERPSKSADGAVTVRPARRALARYDNPWW